MDLAKKHLRGILDQKANNSNNMMEEEDELDIIAPDRKKLINAANKKIISSYVDPYKN